jgi:LPXTG-motif cell wall-anchored protein
MPTLLRIGALIATLALLVPTAALAQTGGGGGAGDSQYQDPFGSSQPAKPSTPAQQQQQPAQQQQTSPAPAAPAPAQSTAPQSGARQTQPSAQTLPRTGFDVLPVAAAGLLLLLGGLALWRRPHGER